MRLAEYLGTRTGETPSEYLKYKLRMMYQIPPSVLAEQKGKFLLEMMQDLACERWEIKTRNFRQSLHG